MNKKNTTLSSITTILIVMVIAVMILLIGNYTKNLNSGIALEYQYIENPSTVSEIEITDFGNNLVINLPGIDESISGFGTDLKKILYRGSDINISYSITQQKPGHMYPHIIHRPFPSIQIEKNSLPIGIPLNFNFYNSTTKTKQTIPYIIEI